MPGDRGLPVVCLRAPQPLPTPAPRRLDRERLDQAERALPPRLLERLLAYLRLLGLLRELSGEGLVGRVLRDRLSRTPLRAVREHTDDDGQRAEDGNSKHQGNLMPAGSADGA
ncbi:MAG: hypothetical protein AUG48_11480 [Actinobacteria bacterium 13_1_20CM_3_68_9]|nr:MAG: hypothetical protein AUG48_11480 [Actinobacteria bacterium 13_1_20CM_3_68_9]